MSILGFMPLVHSNCLTIGLFIYFPVTAVLLPLHNYFIMVLMSETIGKNLNGSYTLSCVLNVPPHGASQVIIEQFSTFVKHAFSLLFFFFQFEVILWCIFQISPKPQALDILPALIKPFPARSGALIQSYPSHPSESGGGFNMC